MPQLNERDAGYLWDILEASKLILEFVGDMDSAAFWEDMKTQSAVIRQQEIIGEATKQLSPEFRNTHSSIPWREIAGMRDILIHAYKSVRADRVWGVVQHDIPALISYIEPLLSEESSGE